MPPASCGSAIVPGGATHGDNHAAEVSRGIEGTREVAEVVSAHCVAVHVSLGLNIDFFQPEGVFPVGAVDATVTNGRKVPYVPRTSALCRNISPVIAVEYGTA